METNFSSLLGKFKEGANSMEEVYKELSHLTSTYDEELDKLQKQITELTIRAQNEEEKRHEAEEQVADLKKLQQINFSTIIDELIRKPREEMENELKKSTKKFLSTTIIITIVSITIITGFAFFSIFYMKPTEQITNTKVSSNDYQKVLKAIKDLEKKNEQYLKELKKIKTIEKPIVEKKEIKLEPQEQPKPANEKDVKSTQIIMPTSDDREKLLEKVALHIKNFDSMYKLDNKNSTRLLYKMDLLDFAPITYEQIIQEISLFAKKNTYIPTKNDLKVWDTQMLNIYKRMLSKIEPLAEDKINEDMMIFEKYKTNDATFYGNWQYTGENNKPIKDSLQKEISRLEKQIELNTL